MKGKASGVEMRNANNRQYYYSIMYEYIKQYKAYQKDNARTDC